jgi:prepilin-type N-terminal cleavage/methylation domain-containing protein
MSDNRIAHGRQRRNGFTLLEMLTVIAIIMILATMAIISINGALPAQQATAGVDAAVAVFRQGRDLAIAQRRTYQVTSPGPNQLQLHRCEDVACTAQTDLPAITLPAPAQFQLYTSIPDTPDGFGGCSSGLCFNSAVQQWFSDGTFVDAAGVPQNATVFIAVPGKSLSDPTYMSTQRAFTILGTTGRIRAYKWTGGQWVLQ